MDDQVDNKREMKREEEILETALAAGAAALLVSALKKFLPSVLSQWAVARLMTTPSPLLLLLLNLVIASIVVVSVHPKFCSAGSYRAKCFITDHHSDAAKKKNKKGSGGGHKRSTKGKKGSSSMAATCRVVHAKQCCIEVQGDDEEGIDGQELNERVEAFIAAFRQQLRVDSFSSVGQSQRVKA